MNLESTLKAQMLYDAIASTRRELDRVELMLMQTHQKMVADLKGLPEHDVVISKKVCDCSPVARCAFNQPRDKYHNWCLYCGEGEDDEPWEGLEDVSTR